MSELTIEQRVAAGAAWLDENVPDWIERIDVSRLDIGDSCGCILGQTFDDYSDSPVDARWNGDRVVAYERGFNLDLWNDDVDITYEALTAEWRRVIESRRAEP